MQPGTSTASSRFATFGFGLTGLIVVTAKGTKWHWDSYLTMILATAPLLSLALFVVIENEVAYPLIDLRVLRCWPYVNSLLIIGVLLLGVFGTVYYLPQFLQGAQALNAHDAGMALLPMGVLMAVPVAGLLYDRVGPRVPAVIGLCGTVAGALLLATGISVDMTRPEVAVWAAVSVLGGGLGLMPIMTNGLNWLPPTLVGHGGAMNNVRQRVASAPGAAAVDRPNAMLAGLYEGLLHRVQASAYADMFIALAGVSAAGLALALFVRRPPRLSYRGAVAGIRAARGRHRVDDHRDRLPRAPGIHQRRRGRARGPPGGDARRHPRPSAHRHPRARALSPDHRPATDWVWGRPDIGGTSPGLGPARTGGHPLHQAGAVNQNHRALGEDRDERSHGFERDGN